MQKYLPTMLICIGILLMALWGLHRILYTRSLTLSDTLLARYGKTHKTQGFPSEVTVGNSIDVPVIEGGKVNGVWTVSQTSANHVLSSALPGEGGNVIIYGHNLNRIFGYLMDTRVGDPVTLRTRDGKFFRYTVTTTQTVSPDQLALLAPTPNEVLTLYTCTGLFDSLRFVVRAIPEP